MHDMMTLQQASDWLGAAPGVQAVGAEEAITIKRVHTDSRSIEPGDLFVALRGERFDANDFLAQAKARGAVAALCQGDVAVRLDAADLPGLIVADVKRALGELARRWRAQFRLPLIAVTGSNGKTTVTQMIAAILSAYKPHACLATQGNFNNDIGLPLTVLRLRPHHEIAVVELGMNHPGEIAALASVAQPTVALIINAQREHLEFMSSVAAVAQENGAVIDALDANGVVVLPTEDYYCNLWATRAAPRSVVRFCATTQATLPADVRCTQAVWSDGVWRIHAETAVGSLLYTLHSAGWHNVKNSLAALTAALVAGVPADAVACGLSQFEPVSGRSRSLTLALGAHRLTLVDDSYNANPDSVQAAIELLSALPAPRLLVLGDMGEVGDQGQQFHVEAGQSARARGIDALFTLGNLSAAAAASFGAGRHFSDVQSLQEALLAALPCVRSVLVKGSRFMKMERLVQAVVAQAQATPQHGSATCC